MLNKVIPKLKDNESLFDFPFDTISNRIVPKPMDTELIEEVWVKGYRDKDGSVVISLGEDGYHRNLPDYIDEGIVKIRDMKGRTNY